MQYQSSELYQSKSNGFYSSFFAILSFLAFCAFSANAHASYTWVTGSYKHKNNAETRVSLPAFAALNAKLISTKAKGLKYRVVVGCYPTKNSALQDIALIRGAGVHGEWLMKSKAGCLGSKIKNSLNDIESTIPFDMAIQNSEPIFHPTKWDFKIGNKVAYTSGNNPAEFFTEPKDDKQCFVVKRRMVSLKQFKHIKPPKNLSDYELKSKDASSATCKVVYIYAVKK